MSFAAFNQFLNETQGNAYEQAIKEGKTPEEARKFAEQERVRAGSTMISMLGRSTTWGMTGAAVGSVVPVVGTAIGGTIGFLGGAVSALLDPHPVKDYLDVIKKGLGG